jgi:hypothetical protein
LVGRTAFQCPEDDRVIGGRTCLRLPSDTSRLSICNNDSRCFPATSSESYMLQKLKLRAIRFSELPVEGVSHDYSHLGQPVNCFSEHGTFRLGDVKKLMAGLHVEAPPKMT